MANGTYDPEVEERLYADETLKRQSREHFERRLYEDESEDKKKLLAETFEHVLYEFRKKERELLNIKREREFEKNRPPQDRWYELKTQEFSKEMYRNRMALKVSPESVVKSALVAERREQDLPEELEGPVSLLSLDFKEAEHNY